MPMDVDYVFAQMAIKELEELLSNMEHDERGDIADDIDVFVKEMKNKYGNNEKNRD